MAPVKKQKPNKSPKTNKKPEKNAEESVISGQLQKKIDKKQQKDPKGVVFINHLPHGFFEEQLKKYFEQFGSVSRVRLARSQRTGNSKGYAFVEFDYPEVAAVAAETMNNYLMFKRIIKASYIPPEKQQFNYFRSSVKKIRNKSGKVVWVSNKTASIQQKMKQQNDWSEENHVKRSKRQLQKLKKIGKKYAHLGIDVDDILMKPNTLTNDKKYAADPKVKATKEDKSGGSSRATKRKTPSEEISSIKQQSSKKLKNQVLLEDLLGTTIQDDSEDEDYVATSGSEQDNAESSDAETYGFAKDSLNQDGEEQDDEDECESEEEVPVLSKKSKNNFGKSLKKSSNVERFDQMIKRKPNTGGVSKLNKKPIKQSSVVAKNKGALQLSDAKKMAKPLSKIKGKLGKPSNINKNFKKVK